MKNLDRLNKLKALAERGVVGERESAKRKLIEMCDRLGIDPEKLSNEDEAPDFRFRYEDGFQKSLLNYIVSSVLDLGLNDFKVWIPRGHGKRTILIFSLTSSQAAEVSLRYDIYKESLKKEMGDMFTAFLVANEIYSKSALSRSNQKPNPDAKPNPYVESI